MLQYRQGDVLLLKLDVIPSDLGDPARRENDRVILAHGEVTGHAHAIASPFATLFETHDGDRYLRVDARCDLTHEEHGRVPIEPGMYRVIRQREYSPSEGFEWQHVRD
jgi:hypothetical protein